MPERTRTYVYVDGFNLYYRALRRTRFKWLNLLALAEALLGPTHQVELVRYFTAPVSGRFDPGQPIRQTRYLQALKSLPKVTIHHGNFLTTRKIRPLADPEPGGPTHVTIWNTEEKGSDVNLATYLVHDAWQGLYDEALILSQDTDLIEPVRILRDELKKPVGVLVLDGRAPGKLAGFGSYVRHLTHKELLDAQFPNVVSFGKRGKQVRKPTEWN